MLNKITISNFKCFPHADFDLAAVTLLAGYNGTGKSTLIQSILLAKQNLENHGNRLDLNGYWVELGAFQEIKCAYGEGEKVEFKYSFSEQKEFVLSASEPAGQIKYMVSGIDIKSVQAIFDDVWFLGAERWGPRDELPMYDADTKIKIPHIGKNGEFTPHYLLKYGQEPLRNSEFPSLDIGNETLEAQVEAWMAQISPGIRLKFKLLPEVKQSYIRYEYPGIAQTQGFRPQNVGFGLSYSLPIVVALLNSKPEQIVIIENPEAHLHPAGQTALGRLIAIAGQAGAQIIVETHSDHILNGLRVAVKEQEIDPENTKLYFFSRDDEGKSKYASPQIGENGFLDEWPDGFFDQEFRNLSKLSAF